jgi:hypothetical protein
VGHHHRELQYGRQTLLVELAVLGESEEGLEEALYLQGRTEPPDEVGLFIPVVPEEVIRNPVVEYTYAKEDRVVASCDYR